MIGGPLRSPSLADSRSLRATHDRYTIWAYHERVGRWCDIVTGLTGPDAIAEVTVRQDRLRRSHEPCRIVVLPDGKVPQ